VTRLVVAQGTPQYIAVGATDVYWAWPSNNFNVDNGAVGMVPKDGGSPTLLADGVRPAGIAVDDTSVYWTIVPSFSGNDGAVQKMPLGGGPITTLASGLTSVAGIALDETSVYWRGNGGVARVGVDGGPVTTISSSPPASDGDTVGPVVDSASVYWTGGSPCTDGSGVELCDAVLRSPISGGAPAVLYVAPRGGVFDGIALTGGQLFFTQSACQYTSGQCGSVLLEEPAQGGPANTRGPASELGSTVAADSTNVYWASDQTDAGNGGGGSSLLRAPIDGGSIAGLDLFNGYDGQLLAIDATSVYWGVNGGVMRLSPK
jgi:hypothetical protein